MEVDDGHQERVWGGLRVRGVLVTSSRQRTMFDDAPVTRARTSDYRIVVCVCRTRVVVGRDVAAVACPACRQVVSGVLLGGAS